MAIPLRKGKEGSFEQAPAGTYNALCIGVADLGMQETKYGIKHELLLVFEIDEETKDGKRFQITKKVTNVMGDRSNLVTIIKGLGMDPVEGFDIEEVAGKPCMAAIVHNQVGDKTYVNIDSVSALPKGMEPLTQETEMEGVQKLVDHFVNKQVVNNEVTEKDIKDAPF